MKENDKNGAISEDRKDDEIKKLLISHHSDNSSLDLCNKNLKFLPSELFVLAHLQHLYLEGNCLIELPDNFFDRLPALLWLDLRNNKLSSLPNSIGRHQCIKHLLLEGNCLTHLPLQLGLVKTLAGLSLQGNALHYPPQHIIDQGVYVILSFLYQELHNRSRQSETTVIKEVENLRLSGSNSSDEEILTENINLTDRKASSPLSDDYHLLRNGLTPVPASLHKPLTFQDYKGKFDAGGFSDSIRGGRLKNNKELSLLHLRHQSDARKEQLRIMRERQSSFAEQRRKSLTAQQSRFRNGTTQKFPSTPVQDAHSPISAAGDACQLEIHDNIYEEKVEKVLPDFKVIRLRQKMRKMERNWRTKSRITEKLKRNVVRGKGQSHLEEARKLLAALKNRRDERSLAENEEDSSKDFKFDNFPFKRVKKNAMVQRKIKQHSLELQNKIKQMRNTDTSQADAGDSFKSNELQRVLLEEKMKKQELEYRFRAFTGSSRSTKSGSHKTSSS